MTSGFMNHTPKRYYSTVLPRLPMSTKRQLEAKLAWGPALERSRRYRSYHIYIYVSHKCYIRYDTYIYASYIIYDI